MTVFEKQENLKENKDYKESSANNHEEKVLGSIMRNIEGKGKQRVMYFKCLSKWMAE